MEGFFYKEEIKTKKKATPKVQSCSSCGLYKNCKSPKMSYHGQGRLNVLAIATAPGQKEDEQNKQLVGEAGQELRKRLKDNHSIVIDRDWYKTNALICKLAVNQKEPKNNQINACRHYLLETIDKLKPKKIICFGQSALQSLIGHKESITSLGKWMGWKIPDQDYNAWIYANYHPSFLLRNEKDIALSNHFNKLLKEAIEHDEEFPIIKPKINIIYNENQIKKKIEHIIEHEALFTFDYETTGLRPHRKGHRIVCVSIAIDKETIVFPFNKESCYTNSFKYLLSKTTGLRKVAQNLKFEDIWTEKILGVKVVNWYWDTMLATHVIDNRPGNITRLKFQTYVNFGQHDYSKEVSPFLELKKGEDIYGFNDIDNCDQEKLLYYCGLDSYYEHLLYKKQIASKEIKENLNGYDLLHQGTLRLKEIEKSGVFTNQEYFKEKYNETNKKIVNIATRIKDSKENKIWMEREEGKSIDINSPTQLKKLLYDYCGYEAKKKTDKGNDSTDEEALAKINIPFTKNIIRLRKYQKINNTYIKNFIDQTYEDYLYPYYNLHTVRSYRSSSDKPNFQNVPKHDEKANKLIRTGIVPRKGRRLLEIDYKGSEVKASACYHHDPVMINYINDKTTDMHRDLASQIFLTMPDEVDKSLFKELRFFAKNNFVFAEFYGDYYKSCATNIWNSIYHNKEILSLLKEKGIKNYFDFEKHLQDVEYDFWNNRFKVYSQWKVDTWEEYLNTLEIKLLTGFTCKGYMKKNDVLNYQIQGTSFHFLLWSLIRIQDHLVKNKFESEIIGQIHDSAIIDTVPEEEQEIIKVAKKIMCEDIRKYWDWIIVPLDIEVEATKINGNWAEKEEIKIG